MKKLLASTLIALAALPAAAQETPTQRDAAREVMVRMAALQQEVNAASWAARLTAPNAARDAVAARARQLMETELLAMSDDITRHPEIGFKETRSVRILTDWLKAHGFEVTIGAAGLETAFVARWRGNRGKPVLGVIVEYDALRGTERDFHGDQHSAQGPIGLAAAVALAEFLQRSGTAGSVIVYGAPAEEMMPPVPKTVMQEAGVFNEADVLVRSHASLSTQRPAPGFGSCCLNIDGVRYIFTGAPAHQMTPWDGRNALSALRLFFNNVDALRGTFRPETRIQGIITEGGKAPNVVPDRAVGDFYVRYPDAEYLAQVRQLVDDAARGAAAATGTKVQIDHYGSMRDGISVGTLNEVAFAYLKKFGATNVQETPQKPQGYEETGSVASAIPGVGFSAHSSNGGYHTYEMEQDALGPVGHRGFVADAQGMAALLYDFATRADYRAVVKKEFDTLRTLYAQYQAALKAAYRQPVVP